MKNILQIMDYAAPYRGNFIPSIECLENHWNGKGNLVYLFPSVAENYQWVLDLISTGKRVYFIDRSFFSRKIKRANIQQLNHIVKNENIEVIHTHFVVANYSLFLYSKLINQNIRIVANLHNHYVQSGRLGILKTWVFKKTVHFFIGDSPSVSEGIFAIGVKKAKVKTVLNSIQFKRLHKFETIDLSKGTKKPVVLIFGHTWYRKGVDIVAKAMHQINGKEGKEVILAIAMVGGRDLAQKAIEDALGYFPDWIEFLPPRDDLATYFNAADMFISAGREEGLSYSPIEAAYCNCQVICSNIPGNPLDIPLMPIYEVEDVEALKQTILELLQVSAEKKEKIKKAQKEYVMKQYDVDYWADEVVKCW